MWCVRRSAELVAAAACHAESARRDDAARLFMSCHGSMSHEAPREHRGGRDEIGFCPTRGATAFASAHLSIFEQPQTVITTTMNGHEFSLHAINTSVAPGHRAGYDGYAPSAFYGLKDRAYQKRYLVMVLGLGCGYSRRVESHLAGPESYHHATGSGFSRAGPSSTISHSWRILGI